MIGKIGTKIFGSFWALRSYCQAAKNPVFKKIALILYNQYLYENGSWIPLETRFAGEPCFPHGITGIFISGAARIGHNAVIYQNVTIGSVTLPDSKRFGAPVIGDEVYIGAGAAVTGNAVIGDRVRIGANAAVHEAVAANSVVVAGEQKIIQRETPMQNRYYTIQKGQWVYFDHGKYVEERDPAVLEKLKQKSQ